RFGGDPVTQANVEKQSWSDGLVVVHSGGVVPLVCISSAKHRRQPGSNGLIGVQLRVVGGKLNLVADIMVKLERQIGRVLEPCVARNRVIVGVTRGIRQRQQLLNR